MDALDVIRRADVDGLELAPPLPPDEVARLEEELGAPPSRELRAVLGRTAAIAGTRLDRIDFTGRTMDYEDRDIFPLGLPFASDGAGNFWVLDLAAEASDVSAVFFACHDPPVVLYDNPDLGHFLEDVVRMERSQVDETRRESLFTVWRTNPGTIDHAAALAGDDDLRTFATELGDRFTFVDLRSPVVGMGFSWGRYGPLTEVRRHASQRLFAGAPPERKPGLMSRLLGRTPSR